MLSIWMFVAAVAAPTAPAESTDAWHANYSEAVAETKQEEQPLLVVFDKPGDESAELDPSLLSAESGAFPLDSYALCHIDATTDYGKQVAEGFKVTEFPHVAIIDKSGSVVLRRVSGDVTQSEWTKVLKEHKNGDRSTAVTHSVSKPVKSTTPSFSPSVSMPSSSQGGYSKPYCPSCQLRNR
ncbi:hypothetical protein [Botrimarina mediterranea]|uniref:Thioredoxin domain-containing protein n=1 Tax=Botrimarina mediterranea TaxID=2528022 RepID=A0A518K439_9BACT|nr:hypothetical protein [Botrimarina mediterranea]QDV72550.1 hypothetical protein Spa11_07280 [Botrimarina mediterranea]QDV77122.1 hypothetical protein K2D_07090 [Planctomycetes bacterium K2D]